jgi:hypothetical protein
MTNDEYLKIFDSLPDSAISPTRVTAVVTGLSERTVRYHPKLPRRYISADRYGQQVGDVRRLLREGFHVGATR